MATNSPSLGRPRSEQSRRAILFATVRLINKHGYSAVTMDAIAAEAGVGKQTIYRWWKTKGELTLEALAEHASDTIVVRKSSDASADLREFLHLTFERVRAYSTLLIGLMTDAQADRRFRTLLNEKLLDRRRVDLATFVVRIVGKAKCAIAVDAIYGAMWYRLLDGHGPIDDAFADALIGLLARR